MKSAAMICVGIAFGVAAGIAIVVLFDTSSATIERQRSELQDLRHQLNAAVEHKQSIELANQQDNGINEGLDTGRVRESAVDEVTAQNAEFQQKIVELTNARDALASKLSKAASDVLDAKFIAERARLELSHVKLSLPTSDADGQVPDTQFYYRNLQWTEDGPHVQIIGEIQNQTGTDWDSAWFQVAGYDESNRLLGVSPFSISRFTSGMVKAFELHLIDVPYSRGMRFKINFEGGDETD